MHQGQINRRPARRARVLTPRARVALASLGLALLLGGCAGQEARDGDGDRIPARIARIPDAVPKVEPLAKSGNPASYVVFGKRYYTKRSSRGHVERGLASWYGHPFHGRKTSSGEVYDMHAMSAAHKTLPLPTYARVTNMENGRSVVVRINDRGPFHGSRIIDLSHTAAVKLGVVRTGTAMVEVRAIDPRRPEQESDLGPFFADGPTLVSAAGEPRPTRPPARPTRPADRRASAPAGGPASTRTAAVRPTAAIHTTTQTADRALYLQVGAFSDAENAERLRKRLLETSLAEPIRVLSPTPAGAALYRVRIGPLPSEHEAERLSLRLAALGLEPPKRVRD